MAEVISCPRPGTWYSPAAKSGACEYTWKAPGDYKGKVKVELVPVMGPFECTYRNQDRDWSR
ncbi:MAG TPA: hypothetical protein VMZ92_20025 [Planctomycetota bacterium]|nr:hypothetical protein [Planctomycetota bacterium]